MNPDWKEPWVVALRSGEYPQAHSYLKGSDGYCCLGVLCHVAADAIRAEGWHVDEGEGHMTVTVGGSMSQVMPPPSLMTYFGISTDEVFLLTGMNDRGMDDFNVIASYIEEAL